VADQTDPSWVKKGEGGDGVLIAVNAEGAKVTHEDVSYQLARQLSGLNRYENYKWVPYIMADLTEIRRAAGKACAGACVAACVGIGCVCHNGVCV